MSASLKKHSEPTIDSHQPLRAGGLDPQDAMRFAVANTVIEGAVVVSETEDALRKWAAGELTDEQLLEFGRSAFGPRR